MSSSRPSLVRHLLSSLLVLGLVVAAAPADAQRADRTGSPELLAVKFHADWCGSCKRMGTLFTDLENKHDGKPVLFVELDLTNQTTRHRARYLAGALGLDRAWREHGSKSGFVLLVDGKTRQPLRKLTSDQSVKQMSAAISEALASRS
ncbi:MAG: thioredoxin family protein [Acidobacteriota bacterium]